MSAGSLSVRGGAFGLDARYDDLQDLSGWLAAAGSRAALLAVDLHRVVAHPDLLASAGLNPAGFARVEGALLAALDGPRGLLVAAARLEARATQVHAAVVHYRGADVLDRAGTDLRRRLVGSAGVLALPLGLLAVTDPRTRAALLALSPRSAADLEALLVEHPELVGELVGSAPSFVSTLAMLGLGPAAPVLDRVGEATVGAGVLPADLAETTGLLSLAYPAGRAAVVHRGTDRRAFMTAAPRDVAGLLSPMAVRDAETWHARQGEVDVRVVTSVGADGRRSTSYIVHVLGTKEWQPDPRRRPFLNDLATNLTAMAGRSTARVDGIAAALHSAGAGPSDPVMLVGHSQGGLVAARAAEQWTRSGQFSVTHVLAAGAPSGAVPVPGSVQVLALESRQDLVVELDATDSPDRSNVTTVRFDSSLRGVIANHDLAASYLPAARALGSVDDSSVRAWVDSADAFLAGGGERVEVRTEVYDVRNGGAR